MISILQFFCECISITVGVLFDDIVEFFINFARGWLLINHEISEGDKPLSSGYSASSPSFATVTDSEAADGAGVGQGAG